MLPYPLTIFEIQRFKKNEPKCNGAYSINNLPKIHRKQKYNQKYLQSTSIRFDNV